MRLILITGFFGSGKTTVLISLARYLSAGLAPKSIVIIENEIGAANVDGLLLQETNYEVRDLTSGCICCSLSGQLAGAIEEIRADLNPQWLLIEASGLAHQTIVDVIARSGPGLRPFSIVLADAQRWDELMENMPMLISTQMEKADLILLNKADAAAPDELARAEEEIRAISEKPCCRISAAKDELSALWGKVVENVCS
ncbi:MAG: cobalamin biosynthesis protein P47K [Candidatus Adiutrix sp.]|jgi:G3E family GTPase|nr:cobalamin biosynthesis protein P47K [Candidatus Adiutrix sp.]